MKTILLVTLALVAGCVDPSPVWTSTTYTPVSSKEYWVDEVRGAAEAWQAALGDDCKFPFTDAENGEPVELVPSNEWSFGADVGYEDPDRIAILDGPDLSLDYFRRGCIMHEFGHAFGLEHSAEPRSVMAPATPDTATPTALDVIHAREMLGCPRLVGHVNKF